MVYFKKEQRLLNYSAKCAQSFKKKKKKLQMQKCKNAKIILNYLLTYLNNK